MVFWQSDGTIVKNSEEEQPNEVGDKADVLEGESRLHGMCIRAWPEVCGLPYPLVVTDVYTCPKPTESAKHTNKIILCKPYDPER